MIVVLLLAGLPFLRATLRVPDERLLPASFEARQVADELAAGFSDLNGSPAQIVLSFELRASSGPNAAGATSR